MVLESHIFIMRKHTDELKARQVAGGSKQQDFISKAESSSPTIANDATIISSIIDDAKESREVAMIDIPNAFWLRIKITESLSKFKVHWLICYWRLHWMCTPIMSLNTSMESSCSECNLWYDGCNLVVL